MRLRPSLTNHFIHRFAFHDDLAVDDKIHPVGAIDFDVSVLQCQSLLPFNS